MGKKESNLIDQIEQDALDDQVPVATALRKCLILGGKSGSEELRDWATRELKGYGMEDPLPAYRVIPAPLKQDGTTGTHRIRGQILPPSCLPDFAQKTIKDEVPFFDGVGGIQALLDLPEIKIAPYMGSDLIQYLNVANQEPFQHIDSIYWQVSHAAVQGLLDQIRTSLTQFVAELRATSGDETPSAAATDQALNVVVNGKRSKVQINSAQAAGQGSTASATTAAPAQAETGFWTRSRRIGAFLVGAATIAATVFGAIEVF